MTQQRSTRDIAAELSDITAELKGSKAARRAFWVGVYSPFVGAIIASYAANDSSLRSTLSGTALGIVAFVLIGGCTFAPALIVRARARQSVWARLVAGHVVMLTILSLGAIALSEDEFSQTMVLVGALWIVPIGGSIAGHALGAAIAARRAEGSHEGRETATATEIEQRVVTELEYATRGWVLAQISRTYTAGKNAALEVELDTGILAGHGYRLSKVGSGGTGAVSTLVGVAIGYVGGDEKVRVTYERTANEGPSSSDSAVPWTSEWEKRRPRDQT